MSTPQGLPATVDELVEDFELFDDWEDRYAYLVDLGRRLPSLPESERTEENRVRGCTSQVWFVRRPSEEGALRWDGDSDAVIVRGLIAVLKVVHGQARARPVDAGELEGLFQRLGLERHLSVNRRNGFHAMVERLRSWA